MLSNALACQMSDEPRRPYMALSVRQPWAYLIMMGQKTIELRNWLTSYRGLLLIHAARQIDEEAMHYFDLQDSGLDTGCLVGAVKLVDLLEMTQETFLERRWEHRDFGLISRCRYGFILETLQVFSEPIPMQGDRGIFSIVDPRIDASVREQLSVVKQPLSLPDSSWIVSHLRVFKWFPKWGQGPRKKAQ